MSMPSLSSSLGRRGAPQSGFSRLKVRIRLRMSRGTRAPGLAPTNLPGPKQAKAFPVPADHRLGSDEEDTGAPVVPDFALPGPQESIRRGEFRSFHGALQNADLMAEGQDFQLQGRATSERGGKSREERRKEGA